MYTELTNVALQLGKSVAAKVASASKQYSTETATELEIETTIYSSSMQGTSACVMERE